MLMMVGIMSAAPGNVALVTVAVALMATGPAPTSSGGTDTSASFTGSCITMSDDASSSLLMILLKT